MTNEFDWRWVVRAVRDSGLIPSWVRHYNLSLIEYLHDIAVQLLGADGVSRVVSGWHRTKLMEAPLIKHGMHYGLAAQRREGQGSSASPLSGEGGWVAERMGAVQPLHHRATAADVDALLGAPAGATPAQLSDVAFARGLQLTPAAAERFVETALADEAARVALEEAGYRELQQQSRIRVAPPQVREATMPQRGQTVGGSALPGPQPGMLQQELQPAQLEPVAEDEMEDAASDGGEGCGAQGSVRYPGVRKRGHPQQWKADGSLLTAEERAEHQRKQVAAKSARAHERKKQKKAAAALQGLGGVVNH